MQWWLVKQDDVPGWTAVEMLPGTSPADCSQFRGPFPTLEAALIGAAEEQDHAIT